MDGVSTNRDDDFYAWTQEQASALRQAAQARLNLPVDWTTVAEEVEQMGNSERAELVSAMARIIEHLLKLEHSPATDPRRGWRQSVEEHRLRVAIGLDLSPSLKSQLAFLASKAWRYGRKYAAQGLERDRFAERDLPAECPYTVDQILDEAWWPENRHEAG